MHFIDDDKMFRTSLRRRPGASDGSGVREQVVVAHGQHAFLVLTVENGRIHPTDGVDEQIGPVEQQRGIGEHDGGRGQLPVL